MNSTQIRNEFLNFFKAKNHSVRPSDTLVPSGDPTLLFTTAGMVQFKKLWAGSPLEFSRATTVQKCLRAGGKGSDLENVGRTIRHHTFFEMLGNFSFGDYFKEEAIVWAWEFITQVLKMPTDKLYVSIYKDDEEAGEIWKRETGISPDRLVRMGDKDNFWGPAGDSGACGPCSEIYYDLGPERSCGKPDCGPECDCERYLEFWNLVFPQFFQHEDGSREPLERRGIDTGMGLERLCLLMQNVDSNYQTDLFMPIIKHIEEISGAKYADGNVAAMNVIADHVRALTFTFSENILPSNEGRGYVLRRILRRAVRFGKKTGMTGPFLASLVPTVIGIMKDSYPELKDTQQHVSGIILNEEKRFLNTLNNGYGLINDVIAGCRERGQTLIDGADIFRLYDTYGFPIDFIEDIATDEDLELDTEGFKRAMEQQKAAGKSSWKGTSRNIQLYTDVFAQAGKTEFTGYTATEEKAALKAILADGISADKIETGTQAELVLDRTPFYAESGGQVGDHGTISTDTAVFNVEDCIKTPEGVFLHKGTIAQGSLEKGATVIAAIDTKRRDSIRRHHSATHLLHFALRKVLGTHIKQAGSMVDATRLRFDFSHFKQIDGGELDRIEEETNRLVLLNRPVDTLVTTPDEARAKGAMALFGEKYGARVRMVSMGDESCELCGGTHVDTSGMIGQVRIVSESSVAAGIRRIEAQCGMPAYFALREKRKTLDSLSHTLCCSAAEVEGKVAAMLEDGRKMKKELEELKIKESASGLDKVLAEGREADGYKLYTGVWDSLNMNHLRALGDGLRERLSEGAIAIIASRLPDKVSFIALVTKDLIKRGYHAGNIVKALALTVDGNGGGRPDMAQAGGKSPEKMQNALEGAEKLIAETKKK